VVPLPGEPRSALCVMLRPCSIDDFLFIATHLDTKMQPRVDSIPLLDTFLEAYLEIPAVLAGDLNALPQSPTMLALFENWRNTTNEPGFF